MATPDVSNASIVHGYRLSSKQNHSVIDFGRCVKENASSAHDVVNYGNNFEISNADCSQYKMETVKTAPSGTSGCVVNCGIDDPRQVAHQGIFACFC
jgi:hypothetical protein